MRHITTIALAGLAAFAATGAFAQTPPTPPDPATMIQMRVNRLATILGLTDAQKTTATTILTNEHSAAQSIQPNVQTNRQSLADAVKNNNTGSIDALTATIGGLEGQLMAIHSKAQAAFYAMLTADQKTKFDARPGMFGGMGPGGPGRGGPGFGAGARGNMRMRGMPPQ